MNKTMNKTKKPTTTTPKSTAKKPKVTVGTRTGDPFIDEVYRRQTEN